MAVVTALECPRCDRGALAMMRRRDSGRVLAECRGCGTGFWSTGLDDAFPLRDVTWERGRASPEEARAAGWPGVRTEGALPADPTPSPEDAAAWFVLGLPLERLPWWAADWLVQGYDSESLRRLAGEHGDDVHALADLLARTLDELGVVVPPDVVTAADRVFSYVARLLAAGRAREREVAAMVPHLLAQAGFASGVDDLPLAALNGIDDEWTGGWGRPEEELRAAVRQACAAQLADRA